jgi:bifunctional NMN adenylyltransferase/nudix hydrolase
VEYKFCVFIGRFQPLHTAHLQVINQALQNAEQLIIVIGSSRAARNTKNPWSFDERVAMIKTCLEPKDAARVHFVAARDYYYSDNIWVTQIQQGINQITKGEQSVALIGSYKDSSSYYIKYFPQWEFIPAQNIQTLNATGVRKDLFELGVHSNLPSSVSSWISAHQTQNPQVYKDLCDEYRFLKEYKAKWANVPFPVTFNTVDAVVVQSGHVLVVRRRFNPGKGLIALPGGFIRADEKLEAASVRELKEETGIRVPHEMLKSYLVGNKVFDHPGRSLRGRTITTAFCFKLPDGELPDLRASDDAETAYWLPLMDVSRLESEFYEDHAHIINHFVQRF